MNTETWGKVKAPEPLTLEKLAIEKETVVATYRAVSQATMRSKFQGGEKVCMLAEGDIVECFENGTNEGGILRMRIATPSNQVGWVSFTTIKDKRELFKTTRSWGAFRANAAGDGCSGWLSKKGGMRTNWSKRWFHLTGSKIKYYETNKEGKGQKEKGAIDLKAVHEVRVSEAPGSEEFFEFEIVANDRTFRLRAFNAPEMTHWVDYASKFSYTD